MDMNTPHYILSARDRPFTDRDAAHRKADILTNELGEPYDVVHHPEGGYAVVSHSENPGGNTAPVSTSADHPPKAIEVESAMGDENDILDGIDAGFSLMNAIEEEKQRSTEKRAATPGLAENRVEIRLDETELPSATLKIPTGLGESGAADNEAPSTSSTRAGKENHRQQKEYDFSESTIQEKEWERNFPTLKLHPSHWAFLKEYTLAIAAMILALFPSLIWGAFYTPEDIAYGEGFATILPAIIQLAGIVIASYYLLKAAFLWLTHRYTIGHRQVKHDWISWAFLNESIAVVDIRTASVDQGLIIGKMFDFGTIYLKTAGSSDIDVTIWKVSNPYGLKEELEQRKSAAIRFNQTNYSQE